jgi:hypothetical protein
MEGFTRKRFFLNSRICRNGILSLILIRNTRKRERSRDRDDIGQ